MDQGIDSLASSLAELPPEQLTKAIRSLTDAEAYSLLYDWTFWARPNQLPPAGDWRTWLILAGRGNGKTRTGAECVRDQVTNHGRRLVALVGRTSADCRKTMVEGEAGLLSVYPPDQRPLYEPSRRQITFANGAIAITYSSEEPDLLRGPAHDFAWVDELASFYDANVDERTAAANGTTWSNLQMGLRIKPDPRQVVTTTPKPIKLIKQLIASETTAITRGTTYENRRNLSPAFFSQIISAYEGTRLGRQELNAEVLEDVEGAVFQRLWFDKTRIVSILPRELQRIVVAIDPAPTSNEQSDSTGIAVVAKGVDGRGYVLFDGTCKLTPDGWLTRAVNLYYEYQADRIVAETNNGGDLVEALLRTMAARIPYKKVHASRGKIPRAAEIATLYEQGRISHVGTFDLMEDEMCSYTGEHGQKSPDRMDALVWGFHELFIEPKHTPTARWI